MNIVLGIALSLASLAAAASSVVILSAAMLNRLRAWPADYSKPAAAVSCLPTEP